MPSAKYIKVIIGGQQADLKSVEELPASISYKLEDPENFQSKKSSEVLNLDLPATVINDQIANTFHNPGYDDNTPDQVKRSFQSILIEANGHELLVGKALLKTATHDSLPVEYSFDGYGNNGDWIIALKEKTLYDFLKDLTISFTKETMESSWDFDGTNEDMPYVFAPVRYGQPMETFEGKLDFNMVPTYMKPALSVYWLIYWGFKSQGYKISSTFMDTNYFRRLVMPWTWGNFLFSEGTRMDELRFLAKGASSFSSEQDDINGFIDVNVTNETLNGAYDPNGVYAWDSGNLEMQWTYVPGLGFGELEAGFHFNAFVTGSVTNNAEVKLYLGWFVNGVQVNASNPDVIIEKDAALITLGRDEFTELVSIRKTFTVNENDVIGARVYADVNDTGLGNARFTINVDAFELEYFRIPLGGTINFSAFNFLKKYKWIDFFAGVLDCFNISPQTDPINKQVLLEPMHPYALEFDQDVKANGFFNGNHIDWNTKQDVSKLSTLSLFSEMEREIIMNFKDDPNDGVLKTVQDRHGIKIGTGKYVFGNRFKAGKKEFENRFFSPVMHYKPMQWGDIGVTPQMVVMIPDNISNTSRDEAQNTFAPKLCFYKGVQDMGWMWDGSESNTYPFMFAVNYLGNGANDPILSYSDEYCVHPSDGLLCAPGLLRRFYLQRFSILRNGQHYDTWARLNNLDVTNWYHREHISLRGQKWELLEIQDYKPLKEESTKILLRKHSPITETDRLNCFPSEISVESAGFTPEAEFDMKYSQALALFQDVKQEVE